MSIKHLQPSDYAALLDQIKYHTGNTFFASDLPKNTNIICYHKGQIHSWLSGCSHIYETPTTLYVESYCRFGPIIPGCGFQDLLRYLVMDQIYVEKVDNIKLLIYRTNPGASYFFSNEHWKLPDFVGNQITIDYALPDVPRFETHGLYGLFLC